MAKRKESQGEGDGSREGPPQIPPHAGAPAGDGDAGGHSNEQDGAAAGGAAAGIAAAQARAAANEQRLAALEAFVGPLVAEVRALRESGAATALEVSALRESGAAAALERRTLLAKIDQLTATVEQVMASCDKGGSAALDACSHSKRLEVKIISLQSELQDVRLEQQRMQGRIGSAEQQEADKSLVVRVPRAAAVALANKPQPQLGMGAPPPAPRPPASEADVRGAIASLAYEAVQRAGGGRICIDQALPLGGPPRAAAAAAGDGASGSNGRGPQTDSFLVLVKLRDPATRTSVLMNAKHLAGDPKFSQVYLNAALTGQQRQLRYQYMQSAAYRAAREARKRIVWRGPVPSVCGAAGRFEALPVPPAAPLAAGRA